MAEELQNLLERIQKDGVEKAEAETERLLASAAEKAAAVIQQARDEAASLRSRAEQDAEAFAERARTAVQQAGRDVVLSVGEALRRALADIVARDVSDRLQGDTLNGILQAAVDAYCGGGDTGGLTVLLNKGQQEAATQFLMSRYAQAMKQGMEVAADDTIVAGFRVSVQGGKVEHDFTAKAIADALTSLLSPQLADIIKGAQSGDTANGKE